MLSKEAKVILDFAHKVQQYFPHSKTKTMKLYLQQKIFLENSKSSMTTCDKRQYDSFIFRIHQLLSY